MSFIDFGRDVNTFQPTVDSLSEWSLSRRERTNYAIRHMSADALPPVYVDRVQLEKAFGLLKNQRTVKKRSVTDKHLEDEKCKKNILICYKNIIDNKYNTLSDEFNELKKECIWTSKYGIGDQNLYCRVKDHLEKVEGFFSENIENINDPECTLSPQYKISIIEHLKALFEKSTNSMDEWINLVVFMK